MDTLRPRERFLAALNHQPLDCVPIFDWITNRSLYQRQTGATPKGFDARLAVRLNLSLGLDALWVPVGGFPCLPYGYEKNIQQDEQTFVDEWSIKNRISPASWPLAFAVEHPIKTMADWQQIKLRDPNEEWRGQYARDAWEELGGKSSQKLAIVGGIRGPFSMAFLMMGLENMSYALYEKPGLLEQVFQSTAKFWTAAGLRLVQQGLVDALVIHEDMGSNTGTFISPKHMRKYSLPYLQQQVETLSATGTPVILHSCGNINALLPDLMAMDFAGLNNIQRNGQMDLASVKTNYGRKVCLIGNVDASNLLPYGTPRDVEAGVVECLKIAGSGGGYILASDHSLHDGIPLENIDALIQAGKKHGTYPLADDKE